MAGRRIFAPPDDPDDSLARDDGADSALVAVGSNLGDREAHIAYAIAELRAIEGVTVVDVSTPVETEPVGGPPQRRFLNAVVLLKTALAPDELLRHLKEIEVRRGRVRTVANGPRVLDLDLVLCGGRICETKDLTLPHPRFRERRFVLEPAAEVAPELVDPVTGRTVKELLAALKARESS
jgi:2-amino-4-hydroxy-6-hydroxymethyldihydropteridine diphosphokinase